LEALLGRVGPGIEEPSHEGQTSDQQSLETNASFPETEAPDAIIPYPADGTAPPVEQSTGAEPYRVGIELIESNPFQPRQDFSQSEMETLAESLRAHGLLQPVVVRRIEDRYQLVAGERRLRAASAAGWSDVPVQIVEADDRELAELAIVENLQRKDLNALEKACSFRRYLDQYGCTQEELASRLKLDRSTISNLIRLLELPESVQDAVRQSKITQGHARALLPLGDEREQTQFCQRIQDEGLSVRRTEALVQETIREADHEPLGVVDRDGTRRTRRPQSEHIASLEQELRLALGTKVTLTHSSGGRGRIVIHFTSHEEFERLRHLMCCPPQHEPNVQAG
jgi:ParB family chromosome partitioning protein